VNHMPQADFAKPETKLGPEAIAGDVIYLMVTHVQEHVGQPIAYAGMNGAMPPWTAEAGKNPKPPE
jgi:hypothetical protein